MYEFKYIECHHIGSGCKHLTMQENATRAFLTHTRDDVMAYAYENEASVLLESVVLIVHM